MNLERAQKIQGWMANEELQYLAELASRSNTIVEIGSWLGRSTCAIAENTTGKVYAVDTWKGSPEIYHTAILDGKNPDWLFNTFKENVSGLKVEPIQLTSYEAAKYFADQNIKFDMIFIDANHDFASVETDILAWKPLLAEGGIMCGHDYTPAWQGVIQAVNKHMPKFKIIFTLWTTEIGE